MMRMEGGPRRFLLPLLLSASILPIVTAEIREFDLILPPTEAYIHYTDGYLRAPGTIDISSLVFEAVGESYIDLNDDAFGGDGDDDMIPGGGGEDEPPLRQLLQQRSLSLGSNSHVMQEDTTTNGGGGVVAHVNPQGDSRRRNLEGGQETDFFVVDVAVFREPDQCAKKKNGCDWTQLGVGAKTDDGTLRWCCSEDAIDFGMCTEAEKGRLILRDSIDGNNGTFVGKHRFINMPYTDTAKKTLKYGQFQETESGRYVVVFSNCQADGRDVHVTGHSVWKSTHGYLPGELYGFLYFYGCLTVVYAVLLFWFASLMHLHKASRIPIEKWILMTIAMGAAEMLFRSSDYALWNTTGHEPMFLVYCGIIMGVIKRGVSRVLMVMVSLGWGVIRDSLGSTMNSIVVLGAAYIGVSAFRDLMMKFAEEDLTTLSYEEEVELFDVVTILTFVEAAIDVIFILWILDALNGTMQYLENMSQMRKLQRYLTLRSILLFAILFATIWVVFSLVDNYDEDGIVLEEHEWIVKAATEVNYLYVLVGISCLWKPNPSAQEYAYVMELPASGGEDGETELELSGVVPSAMDDDDDDDEDGGGGESANGSTNGQQSPAAKPGTGYSDGDERFRIDDAEAT